MIIEGNPVILDVACFHCQQAIEKYFKVALELKMLVLKKIKIYQDF